MKQTRRNYSCVEKRSVFVRRTHTLCGYTAYRRYAFCDAGATVLNAETIEFAFSPESRRAVDTDATRTKLTSHTSNYWITGLR